MVIGGGFLTVYQSDVHPLGRTKYALALLKLRIVFFRTEGQRSKNRYRFSGRCGRHPKRVSRAGRRR
jgi:hypothetical protein